MNGDCSMAIVGSPDVIQKAGLAIKADGGTCSSLLHNVLDYHLADMNVEEVIKAEWEKHQNLISSDFCILDDGAEEGVKILNMRDLGGVFITHAILLVVALITCQYEHWKKVKQAASTNESSKTHDQRRLSQPGNNTDHLTIGLDATQPVTLREFTASSKDATKSDVVTKVDMKEMLEQLKSEMSEEYARITSRTDSSTDRFTRHTINNS